MENKDTICLLKECDAGTKMAVASLDEVMDRTQSPKLKEMLEKSKEDHGKLGNDIHALLLEYNSEEKEPAVIAKGMSWLKTNVKLEMNNCDATIAELITDGCDMGVKSLSKYLNQYPAANNNVLELCHRLIKIEDTLRKNLREYL